MSPVGSFLRSNIGLKFLTAISGAVMIAFVTGHLVGNLQIFSAPEKINGYAYFLQSLGPALWTARIVLLLSVLTHIWATTVLTLRNQAARGAAPRLLRTIQATLASRLMRWTGVVVLAFLLFHLAQFSLGAVQADTYKDKFPYVMRTEFHLLGFPVVPAGATVPDVHTMVITAFQNGWVSLFYIVAIGLLSYHLWHGGESLFQTLGWRTQKWAGGLRRVVQVFCIVYFLGNLAMPAAVLSGQLQPHPAAVAPAAR